jgi:hypothetical protein
MVRSFPGRENAFADRRLEELTTVELGTEGSPEPYSAVTRNSTRAAHAPGEAENDFLSLRTSH